MSLGKDSPSQYKACIIDKVGESNSAKPKKFKVGSKLAK
jgi:hypothetical protein